MKYTFAILSILFLTNISAQDYLKPFDTIVESEQKSACKKMNFEKNIHTSTYDLNYHRLEFDVNPSDAFISGTITSYFTAKVDMDNITFELSSNMIVSQVMQDGEPLTYTQNGDDEVVITFNETLVQGGLDSISISYSGNPVSSGFGSFEVDTHNGDPVLWTLSEPYGAKGWWPCKQDLIDKVDSIDVLITTPLTNPSGDEYVAVSNGLEKSQIVNGDVKTTHFQHQYPIPAYLIAIAVTNYEVFSNTVDNNGNPFEVVNYIYPEDLAEAQNAMPITVDIIDFFSDKFEEYPYADEKYGHAQFGWGGGMEHTTVSFMGGMSRGLIAHELAHQWFGDKITCGSWQDIWLNEGFATYLAAMVIEEFDGDTEFTNWRSNRVNFITSETDGSVYIPATDTTTVSRIFNGRLTYSKGGMVLHMLRRKLGDAIFFQGVQDYLATQDFSFNYAKTPDFQSVMENTSGLDLSEFFNDWIYNEGYPSYSLTWSQGNDTELSITVSQSQSHPSVNYFEAPIPIKVFGTSGQSEEVIVDNTFEGQNTIIDLGYEVLYIVFDPDAHLISKNNTVILGISEAELDNTIEVFPIPADNYLTISKSDNIELIDVKIMDVQGKIIACQYLEGEINIEGLNEGQYSLILTTNKGVLHKPFIKK